MNDPELYVSALSSVVVDITELLRKVKDKVEWTPAETVLDVGSGPGNITIQALLPALPKDVTVVGLDISEEMVKYANECCSDPRVSYKLQDISTDITHSHHWKPEYFNKIFSFYCLHLVPNLDLVAKNLYYLMKKNGYLVTHFCITSPFNTVREVLSKQAKWKPYLQSDDDMSICSMQNAEDPCAYFSTFLKDAGFTDISCQTDEFTYKFGSIDELLKLCKSVTPFLKRVPANLLEAYLSDVRQVMTRIKEVKIANNNEVHVTWLNMITMARKK